MRLLKRSGDCVTYEADFWDGWNQRTYRRVCEDRIIPRVRKGRVIGHRLVNTSRNVSYYAALEKALGIKWGE